MQARLLSRQSFYKLQFYHDAMLCDGFVIIGSAKLFSSFWFDHVKGRPFEFFLFQTLQGQRIIFYAHNFIIRSSYRSFDLRQFVRAAEYRISIAILVVQLARTFSILSLLNCLVCFVCSKREQKESARKKSCEKNCWKVGSVYANIMQTYKVHTRTSIWISTSISVSIHLRSSYLVFMCILIFYFLASFSFAWLILTPIAATSLSLWALKCNNSINALCSSLYLTPHVWKLFKLFELNPLKNEYTIHVERSKEKKESESRVR